MPDGKIAACNLADDIDHFPYGIALAIAQIANQAFGAIFKMIQCAFMRIGQIGYIQVIANAGAVARWIVLAINGDMGDGCRALFAG